MYKVSASQPRDRGFEPHTKKSSTTLRGEATWFIYITSDVMS